MDAKEALVKIEAIADRYGGRLPDTETGHRLFRIAADLLSHSDDARRLTFLFAVERVDIPSRVFVKIIDAAAADRRWWRTEEFERELALISESDAAYRAQADALEIEAMAKRRLADEYDAAQERGEIANSGDTLRRGPGVPKKNAGKATAADLGLSRKDIHEARAIRDAEKASPGIVRRTLKAAIAKGEEPTKAKVEPGKHKSKKVFLKDGEVPPGAMTWTEPKEKGRLLWGWLQAVFAHFQGEGRVAKIAAVLQNLFNFDQRRRGYAFVTNVALAELASIPLGAVEVAMTKLAEAGFVIRTHTFTRKREPERRTWPALPAPAQPLKTWGSQTDSQPHEMRGSREGSQPHKPAGGPTPQKGKKLPLKMRGGISD